MLYFSSLLQTTPTYKPAADRLFAALDLYGIEYTFINQTKDIWLRDFMPVKTKNGTYSSFRYEPSYLKAYPQLRTDYRREVAEQFSFPVTYSAVQVDSGVCDRKGKLLSTWTAGTWSFPRPKPRHSSATGYLRKILPTPKPR